MTELETVLNGQHAVPAGLSPDANLLIRINQSLVAEHDLDVLLQQVTDIATELTAAQFGAFFYNATSPSGDAYQLYTLAGAPKDAFAKFAMPRPTGIFRPTFEGEGPVRLADVRVDPRYGQNPPYHGVPEGHLPVRSYLAVPVISPRGQVHGGLFFGHGDVGVFREREEDLAVAVAALAAVAIDNALLHERSVQAIRGRDEFLAAAAHDLRTPVTIVSARAQLLRRRARAGDVSPEAVEETLDKIDRSVETLARRINWLTDVARTHMGGPIDLDLEAVDLAALLDQVASDFEQATENHRVTVDAGDGVPRIIGDAERIRRVVENLVNNAVKYSPEGGPIRLGLTTADELGRRYVRLSVSDQGVGIAPEDLPRLFEPFHRGRNVPKQVAGSGIGLATARRIVDQHGGRIGVESELDRGSTFTVWLPVDQPASGLDR